MKTCKECNHFKAQKETNDGQGGLCLHRDNLQHVMSKDKACNKYYCNSDSACQCMRVIKD